LGIYVPLRSVFVGKRVMTEDISTSKADVENWRRGYEAALAGKAFLRAQGERTSAWLLGYRDGRALRLKQHAEAKQLDAWPIDQHRLA
jgi:ribosome modulation factor